MAPALKVVGYTQHSMVKGRDVHARLRMLGISTYVWGVEGMASEPYPANFERDDNVTLPTRVTATLDVTFDSDTETALVAYIGLVVYDSGGELYCVVVTVSIASATT